MSRIIARDVGNFIKRELAEKLQKDFCEPPFRIFRERDLHSCCYFHLRSSLENDHDWAVYNEPHMRDLKAPGKGARPDIVLFRKGKPVYIIELKFSFRLSGARGKDQTVLTRSVRNAKWAKKAYYIEAVVEPTRDTGRKLASYRNRKISIFMNPDMLDQYLEKYGELRKPKPRK